LDIPKIPVLFLRPSTALIGPHPAKVILPQAIIKDDAADYEAELAIVIGKDAKDVSEEAALQYFAG
jgi:2-keto-4-pentenoate hydratase/2-oxohepta-3-ene-1,7-dioic acid hydratase in catechol pathway